MYADTSGRKNIRRRKRRSPGAVQFLAYQTWKGARIVVAPFPADLALKAGFRLPDGTLSTGFGPPWTSLDTHGWAGGGLKDGTAAGS